MSKTIPSGANWCQQVPGEHFVTTHNVNSCFIPSRHSANYSKNTTKAWFHVRNHVEGRCVIWWWLQDSSMKCITSNLLCFHCSLHHQFYLGNQVHMEVLLCLQPFLFCGIYKSFYHFTTLAVLLTPSVQTSGWWNSEAEMIRHEKSGEKKLDFFFKAFILVLLTNEKKIGNLKIPLLLSFRKSFFFKVMVSFQPIAPFGPQT